MRSKDKPWLMRTYSGHSSAKASNALYRRNLEKGQTGLSVAFDLPTQTGYDADHPMAQGEVGKVGVPISHLEDMETLFAGIPLERMNTSMTINATAPWLLALYIAAAERRGISPKVLQGTTQNDLLKEFLSRGTHIFPPEPSLRLTTDMIAYTVTRVPKWNPINICSYHLQEAGATPVQELAFAMANAKAILDDLRASGQVSEADWPAVVGRISFFVNAGIRFVEEMCKLRAFGRMWDRLTQERYGITDPAMRRFRYGVQVNSLGLTEQQPENNVIRIVLEALAVTLSKEARARAIQLPAWNEALGLPRPWDQQWSLRIQQILAHETDLLEYEDLFDGSPVIEQEVQRMMAEAQAILDEIEAQGGAVPALSWMKRSLVESNARRLRRIERGEQTVVGVNAFQYGDASPLVNHGDVSILTVSEAAAREQIERLRAFRESRDPDQVEQALWALREAAQNGSNLMPVSIACAHAGVTTGEWAGVLREVFGEYHAPTGVASAHADSGSPGLEGVRERVREISQKLGSPLRMLVGKPGLDGHSNGAEQIALKARDIGFEVVYLGIRLTPEQIVEAALQEDVHLVGLSILSGAHMLMVPKVMEKMRAAGIQDVPVVAGGIIPEPDARRLQALGVAAVFTPKDFDLDRIMAHLVEILAERQGLAMHSAADPLA
ncbi:MAG TPA: protein meaA [Stenomitos sp.]